MASCCDANDVKLTTNSHRCGRWPPMNSGQAARCCANVATRCMPSVAVALTRRSSVGNSPCGRYACISVARGRKSSSIHLTRLCSACTMSCCSKYWSANPVHTQERQLEQSVDFARNGLDCETQTSLKSVQACYCLHDGLNAGMPAAQMSFRQIAYEHTCPSIWLPQHCAICLLLILSTSYHSK
jgi:hypothetical protein